ncbi:MAG: hypothetical protein DMF94_32175 [Acidobacteria bacterium]|nr:MAG: hypothetical protein DMF94_32175 [Acidobacteriota bacterium]
MGPSRLRWVIAATAIVALMPAAGFAQESTVSGTVTDSTGAVLPGVTVTARNEASGNTFVAITDERGTFRLAVRTGVYRITVQLAGFTTPDRNVELLLGQIAVVNAQMSPSRVQETVTVGTGWTSRCWRREPAGTREAGWWRTAKATRRPMSTASRSR